MRSVRSSDRIEEMTLVLEGYRWDAVLLNETWRPAKSEIWEIQRHIIMGAGKYENKHGVGILLKKGWRKRFAHTAANGPLKHRSQSTISASCWSACTSATRDMLTIILKNAKNNWEAHEFQRVVRSNCGRGVQCQTGTKLWSGTSKCWSALHSMKETKEETGWDNDWW